MNASAVLFSQTLVWETLIWLIVSLNNPLLSMFNPVLFTHNPTIRFKKDLHLFGIIKQNKYDVNPLIKTSLFKVVI